MKLLKQSIALRANTEDGETGSFWEKRFYSGAILDESHLMAAMAYVDLNPVKAGITRHIKDSLHTSIHQRLQKVANTEERLEELLGPVVSGLVTSDGERRVNGTLGEYLLLLESVVKGSTDGCRPASSSVVPQPIRAARVDRIDKRQRAYGAPHLLGAWLAERQFRPVELRGG